MPFRGRDDTQARTGRAGCGDPGVASVWRRETCVAVGRYCRGPSLPVSPRLGLCASRSAAWRTASLSVSALISQAERIRAKASRQSGKRPMIRSDRGVASARAGWRVRTRGAAGRWQRAVRGCDEYRRAASSAVYPSAVRVGAERVTSSGTRGSPTATPGSPQPARPVFLGSDHRPSDVLTGGRRRRTHRR